MKKLILSVLISAFSIVGFAQNLPNIWFPASGTDTYTTNISNFGGNYANKIAYVKFANTNTGAATINIGAIGAAPLRYWDGSAWQVLTAGYINTTFIYRISYITASSYFGLEKSDVSSGGALLAANNLSDVASVATSRTNLGLGTLATQSGTFSGTSSGTNTGDQTNISGNAATVTTNANLTGDVTSVGNATTLTNAPVIAKVLTGFTSGAGTVSSSDNILQAFQKINGNVATNTSAIATNTANIATNTTSIAGKQNTLGYTPLDPANNLTDVVSTSTALKNIGGLERLVTYNTQTGDYTLIITDATAYTEILMNKATAQVLTVPSNATAAIAVGTTILGRTIGVGVTTFTPGAGVTINTSSGGSVSPGQYILWSLQKTATNTWYLDNGGSLFNIANSQLANMANYTVKGRFTASTGLPEDLTEDQLRRINFNTQKYYRLYSDFTGSSSEFSSQAVGTGATINYTADGGDSNHPGIVTLPTGTTTTGSLSLRNGSLSTITFDNGSIYFDCMIKLSAVSDATDTYTVRIGLGQSTIADGSEAASFRYTHGTNSGKWQTVTRHLSAETANDAGGSAIAANTYYRLTILSNSTNTSYGFYLNGTLVQTHTNNLPSGASSQGSIIVSIVKSAGTTSRSMGVDMCQVIQEFSTTR